MTRKSCFILGMLILVGSVLNSACMQNPVATTAPAPANTDSPPTAQSIQVTDGVGNTITLADPAQRVISLAPGSTEILFAIGAGPQVVGRDTFSDYPSEAQAVADIGGGFGELNSEAILALKPDMVIASSLTPPEQVKGLEDLGISVFVLTNPADFEGMFENVKTVAQLTGHTQEAESLVEDLKKRLEAIQGIITKAEKRPLVFYELDGTDPNAPWTAGPKTFVATLIGLAGGNNLGDALASDWAQISIEELIARNPDIILIGDATWGGVTIEDVQARTGWGALNAIQNGMLYTFDDNLVARPGPRLVDGLEAMAKLLHPELFK